MPSKKIGALSADLVLEIQNFLSPIKDAQNELKEFDKLAKPLTKSIDDIGKSLTSVGQSLTVGLTLPLVAVGALAVKSFDEQAHAVAVMENAIKSTGGAAGKTSQQLQDMASALQSNSIFGDEKILNGVITQLLTFTNISGTAFDRATKAAADMSTVLGQDLQSSAIQLGKALNSPVDGVTALQRVGVRLTADQKELVKSFMAVNDIASAQNVILQEVEKEFGGAAEAASKAGLGPFTQFKNKLDDLGESFGKLILDDLTPLVKHLNDAVDYIAKMDDATKSAIVVVAGLAAAVGPVLIGLGGMAFALNNVISAYGSLVVFLPKVAAAASSAGITMAAAANAVPWIALAAELVYVTKLLYDIHQVNADTAAQNTAIDAAQKKNIQTVHDLGIAYDATGKSVDQINAETGKLIQTYYKAGPAAELIQKMHEAAARFADAETKSTKDAAAAAIANAEALKAAEEETKRHKSAVDSLKASVIPTTHAQSDLNDAIKELVASGVPGKAILDGLGQQASKMAEQFIAAGRAVPQAVAQLNLAYRAQQLIAAGQKDLIQQEKDNRESASRLLEKLTNDDLDTQLLALKLGVKAWDDANGSIFDDNVDLFNKINGLRETDVDKAAATAEKRIKVIDKSLEKISENEQKAADRLKDAWAASIANLNTRTAESLAEMVVTFKFNTDSLVKIAQSTAQGMLSAFISGLISPLTSKLADLGKSLANVLTGATGIGGSGGAVGGVAAGAGGAGGLGSIGSFLGSTAGITTLGIGAAAGAITAWVKSQAHWEANDLVNNIQNPFDQQVASIVDAVTIAQQNGTLTLGDVQGASSALQSAYSDIQAVANNWAGSSSDRNKVKNQFFATETPFISTQVHHFDDLIQTLQATKSGALTPASADFNHAFDYLFANSGVQQLATGTPEVRQEGLFYLHKGEAVVPDAANRVYGGGGGGTDRQSGPQKIVTQNFTFNIESGGVFDELSFRTNVLPALRRAVDHDTDGVGTSIVHRVKTNWNSAVTA